MKGKGVKDVKQWVLKRTKSAIEQKPNESHEKGNDGPSRPEEERGQTNQALADSGMKGRMDICSPVSAISASIPQKTTFSAKGTEFRVDPRYSLIKPLGLGAYGVVCSANDSKENRKVAIKKVAAVFDDQTDAKRIIREIRLLSSMSHDNILCITDIDEPESYISFNEVYIMTELMDTDLNKLLRSKHPLLEAQRKFFTYQILRALKYIHSASILHRDLKPANVLVSESVSCTRRCPLRHFCASAEHCQGLHRAATPIGQQHLREYLLDIAYASVLDSSLYTFLLFVGAGTV